MDLIDPGGFPWKKCVNKEPKGNVKDLRKSKYVLFFIKEKTEYLTLRINGNRMVENRLRER